MRWMKADWPAPVHIHALTTTRAGGISLGPFKDFNLATHVGDDIHAVTQNRTLLQQRLNLPEDPRWLTQYHSTVILEADTIVDAPKADASYTHKPGIVCAVLTADCLPILLCDTAGTTIAAIHAGWRGLVDGIVEKTLATLPPKPYLAWLGPAIGQNAYPVGDEVRDLFLTRGFTPDGFKHLRDQWHLDMYALARAQLQQLGIDAIYGGDHCTFTESELFYSYRRDNVTGRMATLIWMD